MGRWSNFTDPEVLAEDRVERSRDHDMDPDFHRIAEQCSLCACYYLNWSEDVKAHVAEHAHEIDCTLEQRTWKNEPCKFFQPAEDKDGKENP